MVSMTKTTREIEHRFLFDDIDDIDECIFLEGSPALSMKGNKKKSKKIDTPLFGINFNNFKSQLS